jgi:SulP family sulfate permease
MERLSLLGLWRREFSGYTVSKFRQDLMAGLTVGAVALPLALAFGVASGSTAAAGMVTAILAGLIIGGLSGAPYQISGPTGAMSAILILLSQRYGIEGVWMAGFISGLILLGLGLFRLGRFIAYIPAPVISGFTSGIAVIIFTGQINNFLGIRSPEIEAPVLQAITQLFDHESTLVRLLSYLQGGFTPNWQTVLVGGIVILMMVFWPAHWGKYVPGSLVGIVVTTLLTVLAAFAIPIIGAIPRTILLDERLRFADIPWSELGGLLAPIISISALGAVESLLCGAVASKMTGVRLHANQELIAQGIGNVVIPFFGGVPATAAIARTSVGIKSGGVTRLVSIVHALLLLAAVYVFAPALGQIPLSALAGVLMVTSYRMNEWPAIRFMFGKRFKTGMIVYFVTLLATISLDLTQAIIIGGALSAAIFINQVANLQVEIHDVDWDRLGARGINLNGVNRPNIRVAYLTGPLFFAATSNFNQAFAHEEDVEALILSMRAVPTIDLTGIEALTALCEQMHQSGKRLLLASVQPGVLRMLERAGADQLIGAENFFWSADQAILAAERALLPPSVTKDEVTPTDLLR